MDGITRLLFRFRLVVAMMLALTAVAIGRTGSFVAGGSDSYGYISEARLWLEGDLRIRQDVMQAAPWPDADSTFTPLGHRITRQPFHIVPVYAPGLPLFMAAAAFVGGWCAAFWVVPLCGGVLVISTYAMGARLGRPLVGLAAAVLVVTSPAVIMMLLQPMSDLPAAAALAAALAMVLGGGRAAAFAAGLAVSAAILIRPNLVPIVVPFGLYVFGRDVSARSRPEHRFVTPWFVVAATVGVVVEGMVNDYLYGSPFTSGYGALDYDVSHLAPNLRAYAGWLESTQGPAVWLGLAALAVPAAAIWRTKAAVGAVWFLALYVLAVVVPFLFYLEFDAWWYLRFVLSIWPVMMLATAAVIATAFRSRRLWLRGPALLALVWLAWHGVSTARGLGVFETRAREQKYIDAAVVVEEIARPRDAVLAMQHSGSVRHYAGRMTLRWDMFRPGTLDAAVEWLAAAGHHPYLLVEPWEEDQWRARYGASDAVGKLDWPPLVTLEAASVVRIYDLRDRAGPAGGPRVIVTHGRPVGEQCVAPAPLLPFNW